MSGRERGDTCALPAAGRSAGSLTLERVHKTFFARTAYEITALSGVELSVSPGDFITIIGSNGAGKSTLLNVIAGTFSADAGSIKLDGEDITRRPEYLRAYHMGRVFQDPRAGTAPSLTIEENLCMALRRGKPRALALGVNTTRRQAVKASLCLVEMGLENRLKTQVSKLSGGQRQAMSLLMATIAEPRILLLDEHTAALDPKVAKTIMRIDGSHRHGAETHDTHGHAQHGIGATAWQPARHDACGAHHPRRGRGREEGSHGARSGAEIP